MSIPIRRLAALMLALALTVPLSACPETETGSQVPLSMLAPRIEDFTAEPHATKGQDEPITFTVTASDPSGKRLTYAWSANKGTLSKKTGTTVTWTPVNPNGSLATGNAQVVVEVSNGELVDTRAANLRIDANGAVTFIPAGAIPTVVTTPSPLPSAEAPATALCDVESLVTTWAEPESVLLVDGSGLTDEVTVAVGDQRAEVLEVMPGRLTARLPAGLTVSDEPLTVTVTACDETATGALRVTELGDFGGVTAAGTGLIATVYALPAGTEQLPGDWSKLDRAGVFLAGELDVSQGGFTGFPATADGPLEWFGIRFTGSLEVETPGEYRFALAAADGAKLYLDGKLVVDNDGRHGVETRDATVALTEGPHKLRVEYMHGPGSPVALQLYWLPPGESREAIVPASVLSPE